MKCKLYENTLLIVDKLCIDSIANKLGEDLRNIPVLLCLLLVKPLREVLGNLIEINIYKNSLKPSLPKS